MTTQIVLASNNKGKLAELQTLFAPLGAVSYTHLRAHET